MKLSKPFLFFFIFLVLLSSVSAVPAPDPQQFSEGYDIRIPQDNILKAGQGYEFEFHVYNISNGVAIISDLNCSFHLYNSTGKHIYEAFDATVSHDFDFGFWVDGGNFTKADNYYYNIYCWSPADQKTTAVLGGHSQSIIYVTPTGINFNSVLNNPILLILGLLGLGLVLFGAIKGIPWFGFIGAILFLMVGLYTMIYGFDTVNDMYTRSVAIVFLGMGFIFMFTSAYEWLKED